MAIIVNGELLPERVIQVESDRLIAHPDFKNLPDGPERAQKLRQAAVAAETRGDARMKLMPILILATIPPFLAGQIYHGRSGQATFVGVPITVTTESSAVAVGAYDFNHDGNLDILAQTWQGGNYISVFYGDGKGNFTQGPASTPTTSAISSQLVDMNGDGIPDFLYCDGSNQFYIAYGEAGGTFQAPVAYPITFPVITGGTPTLNIAAADLNGAGLMDVVIAGVAGWQVWMNTGKGFVLSQQFLLKNPYYLQNPGVALGDVNGDGKIDLVYSTEASVRFTLARATELSQLQAR